MIHPDSILKMLILFFNQAWKKDFGLWGISLQKPIKLHVIYIILIDNNWFQQSRSHFRTLFYSCFLKSSLKSSLLKSIFSIWSWSKCNTAFSIYTATMTFNKAYTCMWSRWRQKFDILDKLSLHKYRNRALISLSLCICLSVSICFY